ncbi:chromosome segregation protein Spc25-domain-containing protein [Spinellus fusiger]|nr:chromosome segregation protein Spc25-domain-containing protein [Spinellus fusiger]
MEPPTEKGKPLVQQDQALAISEAIEILEESIANTKAKCIRELREAKELVRSTTEKRLLVSQAREHQCKAELAAQGSKRQRFQARRDTLKATCENTRRQIEKQKQDRHKQQTAFVQMQLLNQLELQAYEAQSQMIMSSPAEDQITFSFKCIDPDNQDNVYFFTLHTASDHTYQLIECRPHLAESESLLKELNQGKDVALFIKNMRRAYCRLVSASSLSL